ncbi:MAG: LysM peptidoglycan-binding domain-containing protein [Deltaproteobacteria bacterium]|nr:LysM peptidoglycan-binding domain-containing protein [Deltaproteobacteria bacterium]MBM4324828.1 LysM peptidoglycan-binding domain-containing protein [Deltaproteobacteria bacterium]
MMGRRGLTGVMLVVLLILACPCFGSTEERYTVKSGDSLYSISKSYGISIESLKEANGLEGSHLKPNQVLLIPNPKKRPTGKTVQRALPETEPYIVKQGDNLYTISKKAGLSIEEIKRLNQLRTDVLKTGQRLVLTKKENGRTEEVEELGDGEEIREIDLARGEDQTIPESLGKWRDPEERNLFVRVVKNFLGVPYRLGGSTLKGIDCSAFVKKMFEIFNVELPRTTREQLKIGRKVKREDLQEGDVIFFKTQRASRTHVGIYIGNNEFIHASYRSKEVRVDNLDTPYFDRRFMSGVRIIELEKES